MYGFAHHLAKISSTRWSREISKLLDEVNAGYQPGDHRLVDRSRKILKQNLEQLRAHKKSIGGGSGPLLSDRGLHQLRYENRRARQDTTKFMPSGTPMSPQATTAARKARYMARRLTHLKPRQVALGKGADVNRAAVMAGKMPGKTQPGLYVAKMMVDDYPDQMRSKVRDRWAVDRQVPRSKRARTYRRVTSLDRKGALELQEFVPHPSPLHTAKSVSSSLPGAVKDVSDHTGNVRLDYSGRPKVIDASVRRRIAKIKTPRPILDRKAGQVGSRLLRLLMRR